MTFTKDNARQYAKILEWLAEDGVVEFYGTATQVWLNVTHITPSEMTNYKFRRMRKPVKRLIRVEELPPTCWVKDSKDDPTPALVVQRDKETFWIASGQTNECVRLQELSTCLKEWKYSSDLKTWHSFEVEEPAKD